MTARSRNVAVMAALGLALAAAGALWWPRPGPRPVSLGEEGAWFYSDETTLGPGVELQSGIDHTCALDGAGRIRCWGQRDDHRGEPPPGSFAHLAVGGEFGCALDELGEAHCWGRDSEGSTRPPPGPFTAISAGFAHACGLRPEGAIDCWGWNPAGQASPPEGAFTAVVAGYHHSCALDAQGGARCWGELSETHPSYQPGPFSALTLGELFTCGLQPDGEARCWGDEARPERPEASPDEHGVYRYPEEGSGWVGSTLTPPPGPFVAIDAAGSATCGRHAEGWLSCWGHNAAQQAAPPRQRFAQHAMGYFHGCGLTMEGEARCWGWRGREEQRWTDRLAMLSGEQAAAKPGARRSPTCPYVGLGLLYLRQGERDDARAELETAVRLAPDVEHQKYNGLARLHIQQGEREEALRLLRRSVEVEPAESNPAWALLHELGAESGDAPTQSGAGGEP